VFGVSSEWGRGLTTACFAERKAPERLGVNMRRVHVLVGIASAGLVAASLVLADPASARDTIYGTSGPDDLTGTAFSDTIYALADSDSVRALPGPDLVFGGAGFDALFGQRGDDTVYGGADGDYLDGGQGADKLYGGLGGDSFSDGVGRDTIFGGPGKDTINLAIDGNADRVKCGTAYDIVYVFDHISGTTIAADCEAVNP
jgi:Ca2+-binding RTX toxin-like protein